MENLAKEVIRKLIPIPQTDGYEYLMPKFYVFVLLILKDMPAQMSEYHIVCQSI